MSDYLLQIKNLSVDFISDAGSVSAIKNINLDIPKGKTLGIVGESGSGKSVTSLTAMGLLSRNGKIPSGEIFWNTPNSSIDLLKLEEKEMRKYRGKEMAMIFQEPMTSLNPVFTCGNQVAEALRLHLHLNKKEAKERCIELFKEVLLPRPEKMYDSYPHELSGGQKQRVMIAMAISCKPQLLIADEPTTALDVTVQKSILELLRQLQTEKGMSMIFITHDLGVIAELADEVAVMYRGSVVEQGSVADIFRNPTHPYTKSLLACRPPLSARPRRLPVVSDFIEFGADGMMSEKQSAFSISEIGPEERNANLTKIYEKEPVLKVQNLITQFPLKNNFFGKTTAFLNAVDDVSFEVYPGETLGLVGESGCGKTTLGRSILRLMEPSSGKVIFEGKDIAQLSAAEMRKTRQNLQIIFQDPYSSLNPRLSAGDAITEPMKVHGLFKSNKECKDKAMELLQKVGLKEEHFHRYPHEFSGGQRQRICIARTLSLNPRFIICDESVSALDVSVQAQVLNLLNDLKRDFGFTYIFISHDLSVVKYMSDRILVMNKGKIEEEGDADELCANPKSEYTRKLIEAIPKGL